MGLWCEASGQKFGITMKQMEGIVFIGSLLPGGYGFSTLVVEDAGGRVSQ